MATVFSSRIPASLQAIFVASNKGEDVHEAPADHSAYRVYRRNHSEVGKPVIAKYANSLAVRKTICSVSIKLKIASPFASWLIVHI